MPNFFIFYLIIQLSKILSEPLVFNFQTRIKKSNNVMESLINNDIYTSILVGSKKQKIEMNIKSQKASTFIVSTSCPQNSKATKFNEKDSSTYKEYIPSTRIFMYEFEYASLSSDDLIFVQNNNKEIFVKNYTFMTVQGMWDDHQENMGGLIGLKMQEKPEYNIKPPELTDFIEQLKEKKIIDSEVFVLDYKDNNNGVLYVGDYSPNFNGNYSINDFFSAKAGKAKHKVKDWEISVEKLLYNDQVIQNSTYIQFFYELGIVAAPQTFRNYINDNFFKSYNEKGICKEVLNLEKVASFKKYNYIECDKNRFDKKSFPGLKFFNSEMNINFELNYEDLFYEYENKIYFLVIFPVYEITVEYWLVGKPFIKKYKLFLDKDKKTVGLYLNYQDYIDEELNGNKNTTSYIAVIIVLILVLISSLTAILYYFLVIKKPRKERMNELENIEFQYLGDSKDKNIIN